MTLRLAVVGLAISLALAYGAVVPRQDDFLFETIQSFLVEPEAYASAFGFSRPKRSSGDWDKEFNLNSVGASVKIKYDDPNNQLKGGKAQISIDNLKQYVKRARSSKVQLDIKFDGGDSPRDGLFSLEVAYELHHQGVEKGVFTAVRSKKSGLWETELVNKNTQKPNVDPIFKSFEIKMKSDRRTMLVGSYRSDRGYDYTFNVDRVPGKKVDAVLEGNGRKYVLNGVLDKAEKLVTVDLDANGFKYKLTADVESTDDKVALDVKVNLGSAGSYSVEFDAKRDLTSAGLDIKFNNNDFANFKMKGKADFGNMRFKHELRYSAVGFGNGKFRFMRSPTKDGGKMKIQWTPDQGLGAEFEGKRLVTADNGMQLYGKGSRNDEKYFEYNLNFEPVLDSDGYEMKVNSEFEFFNTNSVLYKAFCTYGCFMKRTLTSRMYVNKDKPYKVDFDLSLMKDAAEVLKADINTKQSPYVFKLVAPRILPKLLPTGRESIEFEADHNPGSYLHVKSNTNMLSSFNVDKLPNGMRKVELNGKELLQADFSKADNTISQTTTLPDGRSLTTTVSWESDNMKKNHVNLKLDGTERQLDAHFNWDVTNPAAMTMSGKGKGNNKRWGNYQIERDVKMSSKAGVFKLDLDGHAEFEKYFMPSPIETKLRVMLDTNNKEYMIEANKDFNGRKMGVTLNNGKLSLSL